MMKSEKLSGKMVVILVLFSAFVALIPTTATVKPSISSMVEYSDLIVVATVTGVDKPGEPSRSVTFQVKEFLKGNGRLLTLKQVTFSYERMGKGNIDFQNVKDGKSEQIFFLKFVPDPPTDEKDSTQSFHLELTDAWFGMEPADRSIKAEIKKIEKKKAEVVKED